MDIPVYLVAGFLDSGKTSFINGILEDGFAREDKTLLICCEEGDEEYEKKALDNVTVVTVDDEDELTLAFCKDLEKKHRPKQVLIEYNGMWQMEKLYREVLPANWVLYQIMTFVQAPTFELFVKNMGQLMMEKITNADMTYPGATCEATVDGSGNLTKLHIILPLEGSGTGNLKGMSLTVGLKGQMEDTFDITY